MADVVAGMEHLHQQGNHAAPGAGGDADEPTFELLQSGETVEETTMFFDVRDSGVGGEQLL